MNSVIDNKLFALITKSENFEFAYDISERFESIKQRLWDEFWNDFQKKLKFEHDDFNIETISDWEFIFYQRKWKIFKFYFNLRGNSMEYGVGTNRKEYKNLFTLINNDFQEILSDLKVENKNNELWYFTKCDDNVTKLQGLKKILPENKAKIISEYYDLFRGLFDEINDIIQKYEEKEK